MQSNFDRVFEAQKISFNSKFKKEWDKEPQLYLTFLQTLFIADLNETSSRGLHGLSNRQNEIHQLLQYISQKLDGKK